MIYSLDNIHVPLAKLHQSGSKLVLVTGFFDLLHSAHREFLRLARAQGDVLVVGVESDLRARQVKGEGRPKQTQSLRCQQLLDHGLADYVLALPDDFNNPAAYSQLLQQVHPHYYAVSSHTSYLTQKTALVNQYGGQLVVVMPFDPTISTTQIINSTQTKL